MAFLLDILQFNKYNKYEKTYFLEKLKKEIRYGKGKTAG